VEAWKKRMKMVGNNRNGLHEEGGGAHGLRNSIVIDDSPCPSVKVVLNCGYPIQELLVWSPRNLSLTNEDNLETCRREMCIDP